MAARDLTILITASGEPDLPERIRSIAPAARIVTREALHADPNLIEQVDIVYGRIADELFGRAKRLKWLQAASAGMDFALKEAASKHPAVFTKAHIHSVPISEHLFGLLLMLVRRFDVAYRFQMDRKWDRPKWEQVGVLAGATLCLVGAGTIGLRCAELGEAFGMEVIAVTRSAQPTAHVKKVYPPEQLFQALPLAHVVMVTLPNTPKTDKLINAAAFAAMQDGAIFLNAGRGRTVETDALVEALRSGKLAGAALDVTDPEPLPPDHPLWTLPNVVITAHYAGMFPDYAREAEAIFLDNLRRFLDGQPLQNMMDRQEGY